MRTRSDGEKAGQDRERRETGQQTCTAPVHTFPCSLIPERLSSLCACKEVCANKGKYHHFT